jgi:hypothetical protein
MRYRDLPYHWVQWRTPHRSEQPQPWTWFDHSSMWQTCGGSMMSSARAGHMQYRYIGPAQVKIDLTEDRRREITIDLARALTAMMFANRFERSADDPLVQAAVNNNWARVGLPHVEKLIDTLLQLTPAG